MYEGCGSRLTFNAQRTPSAPGYTPPALDNGLDLLQRAPRTAFIHKYHHSRAPTPPHLARPQTWQRALLVLDNALSHHVHIAPLALLAALLLVVVAPLGLPSLVQRRRGHAGIELDALDARATELGRKEYTQRRFSRVDGGVCDKETAVCGRGVAAGRVRLDVQVVLSRCVRGGKTGKGWEGQREDSEVGDCGGRFALE